MGRFENDARVSQGEEPEWATLMSLVGEGDTAPEGGGEISCVVRQRSG
jgi:hypothetical protein